MNKQQRDHLLSRITAARYSKLRVESKKPAKVQKALDVINEWENQERRLQRALKERVDQRAQLAREAVLFADERTAIKVVKDFEKYLAK